MNVEVVNLTKRQVDIKLILNICKYTLDKLNVVNAVFDIILVDNKRIREINREYRSKDDYTDVISFAFEDNKRVVYNNIRLLGEIYISLDKVESQSKEYNHSYERELCFLTVHGLLHLLGYDHMNEKDEKVMRKLEEEILENFNLRRE